MRCLILETLHEWKERRLWRLVEGSCESAVLALVGEALGRAKRGVDTYFFEVI